MAAANVQVLQSSSTRPKILFTANGYVMPVGNSTTSNVNGTTVNIAVGSEVIANSNIINAKYGTANGAYWTVGRGANTYLTFSGNGEFNETWKLDNTSNVVVTLNGTPTQGFLILTLSKG